MKNSIALVTAALLAAGFSVPTLSIAQTAASAATVTPRLAENVKKAAGYEAVTDRFVVANPTPIFSDTSPYSPPTGQLEKAGEPLVALAKVQGWDWILVGRNGVGVGYVPRSLIKPANLP